MNDKRPASIVEQEITWLDRLRAKLEPHVDGAVETLVQLSKSSSRDQVRERAASKIIGLYAECTVDAAKLKLQERSDSDDESDKDNVRVVVVAREELGDVSQQLAASYQAKRAAARDVS